MSTVMDDATMLRLMAALDNARNLFGGLDADVRARLFAVVDNPTSDTWQDAQGIFLRPFYSLWAALGDHTDYRVSAGPAYKQGETPVWPPHMIPTREQIVTAIFAALEADQR